jgi:hypothetical protein
MFLDASPGTLVVSILIDGLAYGVWFAAETK